MSEIDEEWRYIQEFKFARLMHGIEPIDLGIIYQALSIFLSLFLSISQSFNLFYLWEIELTLKSAE